MKADDDTYIVVENLRYFLKDYNTEDPLWFGCKYHPYVKVIAGRFKPYTNKGLDYLMFELVKSSILKKFIKNIARTEKLIR